MNIVSRFPRRLLLALGASAAALLSGASAQQEVGFIEEFALADDREAALKKLIPGTENYYYFHALHYQNTRQGPKFNATLEQWKKRFPHSGLRKTILNREALIAYPNDPKGSMEHIRRIIGLRFDHQQVGKARAQNFPTKLDQNQVSWRSFLNDALRSTNTLARLQPSAFYDLLASGHQLTDTQRRDLLKRASLPDLPELVDIIAADLKSKESRGFGEFSVHRALTIAQLDQLRARNANLIRNENYVHTYLSKLRPGADENPAADPEVRKAYLERAWNFVNDLDPAFNSLKAHLLYQRLLFDHALGEHDHDRFLTYLKLPRNVGYIRSEWRKQREVWRTPADLRRNYSGVTELGPIGTDEPLVRNYLLAFLKDAEDFKAYAPYISESWLKGVFAETKIVNGVGDPERWASLLSPSAFQALKDRVDIEFDPTSPEQFGISDQVKLRLHVKNVQTLIVKVFEVNTLNYYLKYGKEVSTDLDLDGLVTNHEKTIKYEDAPQLRVTRDFTFPEIEKRRGVWVVEFIGGSKSSRAVIRKGKLEVLTSTSSRGEVITVLDEKHQPLQSASVWFGGRRIKCNDKGRALIPFSTDPGSRTPVIEASDGFASLARFNHSAENYQLHTGFQVDREDLRPGAKATLAVRPSLTVAGQPISLSRLSDVRLVLTSVDLDGVSTTTSIPEFKIASDREALHEFRVPNRLSRLQVQIRARLKVASQGGKEIELSGSDSFDVNGQLRTDRVDDLYLSRIDNAFLLELLGRTGEPRSGQHINVTTHRPGFSNTRRFTLKTDDLGGIELGELSGISHLTVEAPGGLKRSWSLPKSRRTNPSVVHAIAGKNVRLPYAGNLDRGELAFFAQSGGGITADAFGKLSVSNGSLVAKGLTAGDYRLLLKESGQAITVRVAKGSSAQRYVFNSARSLELPGRTPAHLASMQVKGKNLQVKVANSDALTRVHLVATRFLPDFDIYNSLGYAPTPGLSSGRPGRLPNLYISGRTIGDEFRYILERRYAQKFPGNMLERPEILLNPWAVRDAEAEKENLKAGDDFARKAPGESASARRSEGGRKSGSASGGSSRSLDFLVNGSKKLLNLQPDKNGMISIDLDTFGDRQHVHVLVVDPAGASYEELSLPERETGIGDLRLVNALDPKRHFTEQDSVTLLKKGESLVLPDLRTARFEVFEDLTSAYRYLLALRDNATLREFSFILRWPELSDEEKLAKYSQYACHELNFFLSRKDPDFFNEVVRPYLKNKRDKTFLDQYFVEGELGEYLTPFQFDRLNALERIVLGRQRNRLEFISMDLRDRLAIRPPNPLEETFKFEGALATGGLTLNASRAQMDRLRGTFGRRSGRGGQGPGQGQGQAVGAGAESPSPVAPSATPAPGGFNRPSLARKGKKFAEKPEANEQALAELEDAFGAVDERAKNLSKTLKARYDKLDAGGEGFAADAYADPFGGEELDAESFYRAIETTKEWAENNYYKLPIGRQNYQLIAESKFWLDYARHKDAKEGRGFGSRNLGEASRNFHEMLLALAVLDLPFKAPESKTEIEGATLTFAAADNAIAFHREIKEAKLAENRPPLLVSQAYFRHGDRHRIVNGEQVDKFVTDEFVAGLVYGAQVVVTNPTSTRQKLDVLIQIPQGAMPVLGHRATATQRVSMEPYTTQRFERFFYFPLVGDFPCYPAHVSKGGEVIAFAETSPLKVVAKPTKVDETSWVHISQWGTEEQVLEYLAKQNLRAIDLAQIAWRCRESADFFKKAIAVLDRRGTYQSVLYSYGIHHNEPKSARQYLLMQAGFLNQCGDYLKSQLVTIDPVDRRAYEHLEYKPLVNNRAHVVGGNRKILNSRIRGQYQRFLRILSQKANLDHSDNLSVTYYLFLQDRAAEALDRLDSVDGDALPSQIQFDYFRAYAAFYESKPDEARDIATSYANHPVNRWRERFATVIAQADEIQGKAPELVKDDDRNQQQEALAAAEPSLELEVKGSTVTVNYEKVDNVQVNYYEMDLEFLFSTNPFVSSNSGSFSVVRPNKSELLQLADDKRSLSFDLPREYQSKNVLVEVIGGGKKRSKAIYSNELHTNVSEQYGILSVRHAKDGRALPATYVKVYALTGSGPKFYKDGYTDLRGKFDYASVSTSNIADAQRFSVLVMSDDNGATVLEAPVPQR